MTIVQQRLVSFRWKLLFQENIGVRYFTAAAILLSPGSLQRCDNEYHSGGNGYRINRCFPEHSRTEVDRLIAGGRVKVNGIIAQLGMRLQYSDTVSLDERPVHWTMYVHSLLATPYPTGLFDGNGFIYIKYCKPIGYNTTTSRRDRRSIFRTGDLDNIIPTDDSHVPHQPSSSSSLSVINSTASDGQHASRRILPVGRLDNQSSGLLLLTSDTRLPKYLLGSRSNCVKVYHVKLNLVPTAQQLRAWTTGISIRSPVRGQRRQQQYPTLPCEVRVIDGKSPSASASARRNQATWVEFRVREGRNRQIRRMVESVGLKVVALHRVQFGPITLEQHQHQHHTAAADVSTSHRNAVEWKRAVATAGMEGKVAQAPVQVQVPSGQQLLRPGQWAHLTTQEISALRHSIQNQKISS